MKTSKASMPIPNTHCAFTHHNWSLTMDIPAFIFVPSDCVPSERQPSFVTCKCSKCFNSEELISQKTRASSRWESEGNGHSTETRWDETLSSKVVPFRKTSRAFFAAMKRTDSAPRSPDGELALFGKQVFLEWTWSILTATEATGVAILLAIFIMNRNDDWWPWLDSSWTD